MRMTVLAAVGAILISALAGPGLGLPIPGQDDAGSGGDAPDQKVLAMPLGPGSYRGNLTWHTDRVDAYRLYPPPTTVVRVDIEAPRNDVGRLLTVDAYLEAAHGRVEANAERGNLSITAGYGRPVNLTFTTNAPYAPPPTRYPYNFHVTFETHDHAVPLDGRRAMAAAWSATFPPGQYGRLEAFPGHPVDPAGPGDAWFFSHALADTPERCLETQTWLNFGWHPYSVATGRAGLNDEALVWSTGAPADVEQGLPVDSPYEPVFEGPGVTSLFDVERADGNFSAHYAEAWSRGSGLQGWVVWDGPVPPVLVEAAAEAEFLTLADFDEGGPAAQIGPYAAAEDLIAVRTVEAGEPATNFIVVDASTPRFWPVGKSAREDTVMTVKFPGGGDLRLEDELRAWITGGFDTLRWADELPATGDWTFGVEHVDGLEGDRKRVALVHFGVPANCHLLAE